MTEGSGLPDWFLAGLAGLIGGAARSANRPDHSWARRIGTSLVGGLTSVYLTPVVAPVVKSYLASYEVTMGSIAGLCGFLLGMAGLSLCEAVIRRLKKIIAGGDAEI